LFCGKVKEFLRQKDVRSVEKGISRDEAALNELLEKGSQATPVTVIDGEAVVGFNRAKLEELLRS
jgi:glutaredoxin 3